MPIEIKELHIRVEVSASPTATPASGATASPSANAGGESDKDAIVAECVEQVLQILQSKTER